MALLDYINEPVTKSEVLFKRVRWLKGYLTFDLFQGSHAGVGFYRADVSGHMWTEPSVETQLRLMST